MLSTNNNIDFKQVAKNLKKELSNVNFDLSHSATLNLLARSIGYKNYNTFEATNNLESFEDKQNLSNDEEQLNRLLLLVGLTEKEALEATLWTSKSQFSNLINDIITETKELIGESGIITLEKFYLDSYESIFYKYISNFLPRMSDIYLSEFYLEKNRKVDTSSKKLKDVIQKIASHDLMIDGIENHVNCSEKEYIRALKYATLYEKDKNGDFLELVDTPDLELLVNMLVLVSTTQVLNIDEFNRKYPQKLDENKIETLNSLEYKLLSINGKVSVSFYPILLLNKLGKNRYQVYFNELFEKIAL